MRYLALFITFFSIILVLPQCTGNSSDNTTYASESANSKSNTQKEKVNGKAVYKQYCILCHGADGKKGFNQAKDLTDSEMTLNERIKLITNGKNNMTPFKNVLSDKEIKAVAEYSMKLSKN